MATRRKPGRRADRTGRSVGAGKFVRLHEWLLDAPAYRSLSTDARALLIEVYRLYNGSNNGELFLSAQDAGERIGKSRSSGHRALAELQDNGFLKPHVAGAFTVKERHATTWVLTEHPFAGQPASKDFMAWSPTPKKQNTVPPVGQTVPQVEQMAPKVMSDTSICSTGETDSAEIDHPRSHGWDTYNLPCGGASPAHPTTDISEPSEGQKAGRAKNFVAPLDADALRARLAQMPPGEQIKFLKSYRPKEN